jgi:two-component system sensor histidine kinase MprB
VTFRVRVILTVAVAVAIAVLVACLASYLSTRNAVLRSVDESLEGVAARTTPGDQITVPGVGYVFVPATHPIDLNAEPKIDQTVLAVAQGQSPQTFRTGRTDEGDIFRELIVPVAAGDQVTCPPTVPPNTICRTEVSAAEIFYTDISGEQHQLHLLALRLIVIALAGIVAALALSYLASRSALEPLESVTNKIEEVAETSNISYQLEEGRDDELGRLRRVFNKLLRSVDHSQAMQRQLVIDASHELRTPLTSLRTNAQVLRRSEGLSHDDLEQITGDMISQVDELTLLISDLTELARAQETVGPLEEIHLDELVDECVSTARTHARVREVTIDSDVSPSVVRGRRERIVRAVNNLINNAIKFAPERGRVTVQMAGGVIKVADDGPGVDAADAPYIFERFWRSSRARSLPGSGLGLAIVNQVATEMGGSVRVERSEELGGAQFVLELPTIRGGG